MLLLLRTIIGLLCTFLGLCMDAEVFTSLYRQRRASVGGEASWPVLARKTLDEYLNRPKAERAARRVAAWLAN